MAARRNVNLTTEHRDLIAAGELSLNELGGRLGVTRQTLHTNFKRRGWPTTPMADAGADDAPERHQPAPGSLTRQKPASARSASPTSSLLTAPVASPGPPAPPAAAIASSPVADDGDLLEVARQELANVGLLVLAQTRNALARTQPGPQGIKALAAAAALADQLLRRAGLDVANPADAQVPRMVIAEMTAAECEAARAAAEAEHNESFGAAEDDDELDGDIDRDAPQLAAA